jgi:hypothetical protein
VPEESARAVHAFHESDAVVVDGAGYACVGQGQVGGVVVGGWVARGV